MHIHMYCFCFDLNTVLFKKKIYKYKNIYRYMQLQILFLQCELHHVNPVLFHTQRVLLKTALTVQEEDSINILLNGDMEHNHEEKCGVKSEKYLDKVSTKNLQSSRDLTLNNMTRPVSAAVGGRLVLSPPHPPLPLRT